MLHRRTSSKTVAQGVADLKRELDKRGLTLFAVFDHRANSAGAGLNQPGATVLVFGNPAAGGKLMQTTPELALDLPLRMLVVEHDGGCALVWRNPQDMAVEHGADSSSPLLSAMENLLQGLAEAVA